MYLHLESIEDLDGDTDKVLGYPRCHWKPPLGDYLPCIAQADALVIDFGVKNRVVAL